MKLILQPILENAIKHGIQAKRGNEGRIEITGEKEGDRIRFRITDNGAGLDGNYTLTEREEGNSANGFGKTGYGLRNVKERMELYFGSDCLLEISGKTGEGTEVLLEWPAVEKY